MILLKEKPFVYSLLTTESARICSYCLSHPSPESRSLKVCSKCKFARYCGRRCQELAWQDHKDECKCLAKLDTAVPDCQVRLFARAMFKIRKTKEPLHRTDGPRITTPENRQFRDLISHVDEVRLYRRKCILVVKYALLALVGEKFLSKWSNDEFDELFGKITVNWLTISHYDGRRLGCGIYLNATAIDHSCKPNALYFFDGPDIIISTCTTGTNLASATIPYYGFLTPSHTRQQRLRENYFFDCKCETCLDETFDKKLSSYICNTNGCKGMVLQEKCQLKCTSCGCVMSHERHEQAKLVVQRILKLIPRTPSQSFEDMEINALYASTLLHPQNYAMICLSEGLFYFADEIGLNDQAIYWGKQCLANYKAFGLSHPFAHSIYLILARNFSSKKYLLQAALALKEAKTLAECFFGRPHKLFDEISTANEKIMEMKKKEYKELSATKRI